jgi:hypothetical protein
MSSWHSPQSIFGIAHREAKALFSVPVQVQEKIDGSFFAFGLYTPAPFDKIDPNSSTVELRVRSKGAIMVADAPPALFKKAVEAVKARQHLLKPGWMYRGETLAKPKHNALAYDRTPKDNVILFDILTDEETYLTYEELVAEGERIGLEVVPQLYTGWVRTADEIRKFLDTDSVLGGQKIEGVVLKPLVPVYSLDKKLVYAKFVSEAFKEVHRKAWGESNPGPKDVIQRLGDELCNAARWGKALIHLRERGLITDSPRDIGLLIKEVGPDIRKEEEERLKEELFKYAWPHISRIAIRGLPEWYKDQLLTQAFEKEANE